MIAPGASPGFACEYQQPRRGVRNSYAPTGLILALMVIPRLAPSAIVFRRYAAGFMQPYCRVAVTCCLRNDCTSMDICLVADSMAAKTMAAE